jgi:cell shape-determining protein MreC
MNQRRRIFFAIFGLYHLCILFFVIYVESRKDLSDLLNLYSSLKLFKYGALLGLVLFIIDVIWNFVETRSSRKEHETLRHENNTLKAKVYDLQQSPKVPTKETPPTGAK